MIVRAVGLTVEHVPPARATSRPTRTSASEWLVVTSDHRLRSHVAAAIDRHGGVVRDRGARGPWCPLAPSSRRCAFVDLVAANDGLAAGLLADLACSDASPRPRLIVRGGDGDAEAELLARKAGAIAYLAGELRAAFLDSLIGEIAR